MAMFGLVDCNNFYASCERAFNPKLINKPIIVLSNNDGCVIARSDQAKALGIPMGIPYFKVAALCQRHQVTVCSSNYTLYGDMSRRVMDLLQSYAPDMEIYSIDEAFLRYPGHTINSLLDHAQQLRQCILKGTGIPTSIGLAPTKTLAKVANLIAKKETTTGVLGFTQPHEWQPLLARLALTNVWGIGKHTASQLLKLGITTPLTLAQTSPQWIRHHFNVTMERTVYELNGISCHTLEHPQPNKQIIASRAFGHPVTLVSELKEAACYHATRAFEKLRQQHKMAPYLQVWLATNPFSSHEPFTSKIATYQFIQPTQDSRLACQAARTCIDQLFKSGIAYKKVGIMLGDLQEPRQQMIGLFNPVKDTDKAAALMNVMDTINQKGKNRLFVAAQGIRKTQTWHTQPQWKSPSYTTRWDSLMRVQ